MTPTSSVRRFDPTRVAKPSILEGFVLPPAFADGASVDLEIGCGVGWHPIRYSLANPHRRLIAIEHTREKFEKFRGRFEKNDSPSNLLPIHADAVRWITHALDPNSIDRVFLLYPNPEPNAPNKRWFRSPFFERLLSTVKPGGSIHLATNVESYMEEAIEYALTRWNLEIAERRSITRETARLGIPRTHFEKKYLERGESCFDTLFVKKVTP